MAAEPSSSSSATLSIKQLGPVLDYETRRVILDGNIHNDLMDVICNKLQRLSINKVTTTIDVCFSLVCDDLYWLYTNDDYDDSGSQFQGRQTHTKEVFVTIDSSVSYHAFYTAVVSKLHDWGEEFDRKYRHPVINKAMRKIVEIANDVSNKDLQYLKVIVKVSMTVNHFSHDDWNIAFQQELLPLNRMIPATKSSVNKFINRIKADECIVNEDCVICFEKFGKRTTLLSMPCSHIFHGDCITKWLETGHVCPICRYKMPTVAS